MFLNSAGFIKIDSSALGENTANYVEVLDGSRIHPETYEWARKMAVDALEYDEVSLSVKIYTCPCIETSSLFIASFHACSN